MPQAGPAAPVKSAERVIRIFELFAEAQRPLTLSEIAASLALPVSSAHALARSLTGLGYLNLEPETRTYVPTVRLALLGGWVHDAIVPGGKVLKLMSELSEATRDTIILSTRNDTRVEVLSAIPGRTPLRFQVKSGGMRPLTRSTMGHVLLSALDDAAVEGLARRINAEESRNNRRVPVAEILRTVRAIRAAGFAYAENFITEGVAMVATHLPDWPHQERLVISVSGPVDRLRPRRGQILDILREVIERHAGSSAIRARYIFKDVKT